MGQFRMQVHAPGLTRLIRTCITNNSVVKIAKLFCLHQAINSPCLKRSRINQLHQFQQFIHHGYSWLDFISLSINSYTNLTMVEEIFEFYKHDLFDCVNLIFLIVLTFLKLFFLYLFIFFCNPGREERRMIPECPNAVFSHDFPQRWPSE